MKFLLPLAATLILAGLVSVTIGVILIESYSDRFAASWLFVGGAILVVGGFLSLIFRYVRKGRL